jgi:hypothetical protein
MTRRRLSSNKSLVYNLDMNSTSPDVIQATRAAFDELDFRQLAVFARLTPTRRLHLMFDLCEFSRQMIIATERQRHPRLSDEDLAGRVRARIELGYDG